MPCKSGRTPDVITVLMSDENGVDICRLYAGLSQLPFKVFQPETAINQHTRSSTLKSSGLDQRAVASAAAA